MIPRNLQTRLKKGVTGVTRVTEGETLMQQGSDCHTFLSHRHPCHTLPPESVTPFLGAEKGVTKRCDTQSPASKGSDGVVTPVTPVTPFLELPPRTSAETFDDYPRDPDSGAEFMPWCSPVAAGEFVRWRNEVVGMIEQLADIEGWAKEHRDEVLSRAIRGPVSDLRPNWHYFKKRLKAVASVQAERRTHR